MQPELFYQYIMVNYFGVDTSLLVMLMVVLRLPKKIVARHCHSPAPSDTGMNLQEACLILSAFFIMALLISWGSHLFYTCYITISLMKSLGEKDVKDSGDFMILFLFLGILLLMVMLAVNRSYMELSATNEEAPRNEQEP